MQNYRPDKPKQQLSPGRAGQYQISQATNRMSVRQQDGQMIRINEFARVQKRIDKRFNLALIAPFSASQKPKPAKYKEDYQEIAEEELLIVPKQDAQADSSYRSFVGVLICEHLKNAINS